MYMERVYHLQVEFCEISHLLARSPKLDVRNQLAQRKMEIIAEASELVYALDTPIQRRHFRVRSSRPLRAAGVSSD
jgi:hypothetical protein